jgi:DUF3108-like
MKHIIFFIASLLIFGGNIQAQEDTCLFYFIKGDIGSSTIININNSSGSKIGTQKTEIVEKSVNADTTFLKIKNVTSGIGPIVTLNYAVKCYDNNSYIELKDYLNVANYVDMGVMTIEPEWMIMPSVMEAGDSLVGYVMTRDYGSSQIITKMINRKVESFETVTTPAGDFECVKFSYTIEATTGYGVFISNYFDWYNKDVGLVKQEAYTKTGRLENSFVLQEENSIELKVFE